MRMESGACRCYAAGRGDPCDSARQKHHIVKRQKIRGKWRSLNAAHRRGIAPKPWSIMRALQDPRNLIVTCYRHHKEETAMPLPDGFWDFVAEYDLYSELPRWLHGKVPA